MRKRRNILTGELEDYPPPQTFLCPEGTPPSRDTVSEALGFRAPAALVELAQHIYNSASGDPYSCVEIFAGSLGISAASGPSIYDSTPCELFPIGYPGVDGVHYGCLVLAPELEAEDYPIAHFCPMDSDGVSIVGHGTHDGIASIMTDWGNGEVFPDDSKWHAAVESARKKGKTTQYLKVGDAIPVPRDWKYQPSADGVGVLASASLFASDAPVQINPYGTAEPFVAAADGAIEHGHLATALYYLREGYWHNWSDQPIALSERMCDVYDKLGRPSLANVMRTRIAKWKNGA